MKRLTKQECFNNAWKSFVVKKRPKSQVSGPFTTTCLYQHPIIPTHGCSIGVNLTQKQRDEVGDFFGRVKNLFDSFPSIEKRFPEKSIKFLNALQWAHDAANTENFSVNIKSSLKRLAKNCKLTIPR